MVRIALGLEYCGTGFEGWQSQPHGRTVQDVLEAALAQIAGSPVAVTCAGRTDTGVHAAVQVVHFDVDVLRPLTAWVRGVNSHLPGGVVVCWAREVDDAFHARFSARSRRYRYLLLNRPQRSALYNGRVGWFHTPLDIAAMQQACALLPGTHDFSAFRAAGCQARTPVRELTLAAVAREGDWIIFDFEANAFLHHMIRNLVGALVHVGKGAAPAAWMGELLQMKDRRLAPPTFAADGLYLAGVSYPDAWALPQAGQLLVLPGIPGGV